MKLDWTCWSLGAVTTPFRPGTFHGAEYISGFCRSKSGILTALLSYEKSVDFPDWLNSPLLVR
jgi:hypothetical protein